MCVFVGYDRKYCFSFCLCRCGRGQQGLVSVTESENKQPSLIKIKGKQENSLFCYSEAPDADEMKWGSWHRTKDKDRKFEDRHIRLHF